MRSMTGYGKAESESGGRKITIELKSVNHRFLDLNMKMPRLFNSFEQPARQILSEAVGRGHVDVYVSYVDKSEKSREAEVDLALARALINAGKTLEAEFGLLNDVTVLSLLKSSDVVKFTENEDGNVWQSLFLSTLNSACGQLNMMREFEGEKLKGDLASGIKEIEKLVEKINEVKDTVAKEYSEKLKLRIKEALSGVAFDEARFLNEIAYFVDKSNIDEEIARLLGHIEHFRKMLKGKDAAGKQLDFLVQELNREANTVCSKSNNGEVTALGLKLKSEIEKIREQVQNAE